MTLARKPQDIRLTDDQWGHRRDQQPLLLVSHDVSCRFQPSSSAIYGNSERVWSRVSFSAIGLSFGCKQLTTASSLPLQHESLFSSTTFGRGYFVATLTEVGRGVSFRWSAGGTESQPDSHWREFFFFFINYQIPIVVRVHGIDESYQPKILNNPNTHMFWYGVGNFVT